MERDLLKTIEREKELNILKSRFVTMASHELRTPLSTILSSAFLLENYSGDELEREKPGHINKIKRSVNNLTELLNDLISLGKLEEDKIKPNASEINIMTFLEDLVPEMELSRKSNQVIRCEYSGEDNTVFLDKQLLRSILMNLIGNAIKYSSSDSEIRIQVDVTDSKLMIKVIDQGMGIPPAEQHHIFKRFYRAQNAGNIDGSGLGLNIVRKYVKLMKGSVDFQSILNQGTTFTVTLPVTLRPVHHGSSKGA
jgi:signal transduction histidine kinase